MSFVLTFRHLIRLIYKTITPMKIMKSEKTQNQPLATADSNSSHSEPQAVLAARKILPIVFLFSLFVQSVSARSTLPNDTTTAKKVRKERTVTLNGRTIDSFTKADIKSFVTVMTRDSAVVDTTTVYIWDNTSYFELHVPMRPAKYILKAEAAGYAPGYVDYDIKYIGRNRDFEVPPISMKRLMEEDTASLGEELEGVTVKGTRIKVIHKGDTLVFNASAFKLPEGSMLDGLIRQMPGVELKDNGDIYVNGRKVDFLTLNGEDFFKGNNKMMLENLPYYTVETVQVYNKDTERNRMTGLQTEMKDYVMDVKLKRQYNRNVMANIEAGGGTRDRYMARLFSLYFDDRSRVTLFANSNNVNENRKPGEDGDWSPEKEPNGVRKTNMIGLEWKTADKDKNIKNDFNASFEWENTDRQTRSAAEQFTTGGSNIFSRSDARDLYRQFTVNATNTFSLEKPISVYSITQFMLYRWDKTGTSRSATFNTDVDRYGTTSALLDSLTRKQTSPLEKHTLNVQATETASDYDYVMLSQRVSMDKKLAWGDHLNMQAYGSWSKQLTDNFTRYSTRYPQNGDADTRNTYCKVPKHNYDISLEMAYAMPFNNGLHVVPGISFSQSYNSDEDMWYRLDRLGGKWSDPTTPLTMQLPSTREEMMQAMDADNSYRMRKMVRSMGESLSIGWSKNTKGGYQTVNLNLPLTHYYDKASYLHLPFDTTMTRHYTTFTPQVAGFVSFDNYQRTLFVIYNAHVQQADWLQMAGNINTRQSSAIRLKNPNLGKTVTHNWMLSWTRNKHAINQTLQLTLNGNIRHGAVGTRTYYLPQTGTYIYQSGNVDGNWTGAAKIFFGRNADKKKHIYVSNYLTASLEHNVDFSAASLDLPESALADYHLLGSIIGSQTDNLSKVNTLTLTDQLKAEYTLGDLKVGLNGQFTWYNSTSNRTEFETISASEFNYGATLQYKLPLAIQLATDIKMFSRRGYQTAEMNTDDLIWNASLSRSFVKGKLTCKLEAFDILHQLSNTTYTVNAQGHVETWANKIPNYAMLHVIYKFAKK